MPVSTILVVDDEQLIRWSLKDRLTDEGYRRRRDDWTIVSTYPRAASI